MASLVTPHGHRRTVMGMIWGVLLHELRQHAYSSTMPVFICGFLLFLISGVFFIGNFLDSNLATLDLQWQFLVWISIFLVPALAMRSFDGYKRSGSVDLLLSLPLPPLVFIVGKWMSGAFVLLAMLLLTFPMVVTIAFLGQPDWGVVFSGYFGATLLLFSLYAVAILAAVICNEKVSAFLLGIALVLGLLVCDIERSLLIFLPDQMKELISYSYVLSPRYWFREIVSGDVTLASVLYFLLLSAGSLWIASRQFALLRQPTHRTISAVLSSVAVFIALVGVVASITVLTSRIDIGVDASAQRQFTLNEQTANIVRDAPQKTKIQFFSNMDMTEVPLMIRQHRDRVERLLKRMERVSNGRIEVDFIALSDDTEGAELAQMDGVAAVPMSSGDNLYLGAVFTVGEKKLSINYFDHKRAALLEYDVALQISNLSREGTPRIGVLSSFLKPKNALEPHSSFSILEELKSQYDVTVIPQFADVLPGDIDVLIVIDTPILRRGMLVAIDKHISSGSGALLLVDPHQRMNEANASLAVQASEEGEINTLGDLLSSYGLEMANDKIVGDDLNPSLVRSSSGKAYPFPYWMELGKNNISRNHPVSSLLNKLLFADAGHFEITDENQIVHSIVYTSAETAELSKYEIKKQSAEQLAANFAPGSHPPRNLVVYIDGPIEQAFADGDVKVESRNASLFAVSDADWIYNGYSMTEAQVGGATMPRPINDNFSLFLNIVEYLAGDERLMAIRSRGNPVRSFERVEEMLNEARRTYREREADYLAQISKAESSIAEVMQMTGAASREQLPDDLQQQVMQLQALAYPIKRNLRTLRQRMRKDVSALFRNIVIFNIAVGPILVIGVNALLRWRRRQSRLAEGVSI